METLQTSTYCSIFNFMPWGVTMFSSLFPKMNKHDFTLSFTLRFFYSPAGIYMVDAKQMRPEIERGVAYSKWISRIFTELSAIWQLVISMFACMSLSRGCVRTWSYKLIMGNSFASLEKKGFLFLWWNVIVYCKSTNTPFKVIMLL